jgi:tetratricopeptide (TPR) repeat protein
MEFSAAEAAQAAFFQDPRQDLMNRIFNYSAFLLNSGMDEDCIRWALYASPKYPDETRWQEYIRLAANNRVTRLIRAGNFAGARIFLDNQKTVLSPANYAQFDTTLIDSELLDRANKIRNIQDGDSVAGAIVKARNEDKITEKRTSELLTFAVQKTASVISANPGRDLLAAIKYIESAIVRFGSTREIDQTLEAYKSNRAADFHNRFAAAWNRKNYDEAQRILDEGLAEYPSNRQLLMDKETVNRNRR